MGEGERKQLVLIEGMMTQPGYSGADIGAFVMPTVRQWLLAQGEGTITIIGDAMHAWLRCSYGDVVRHWQQAYSLSYGRLSLAIHCDATSLDSDPHDLDPTSGLRMGGHNVDHPMHQLGLLVGLAKLNELARADGI